jgi:hypothetical protein
MTSIISYSPASAIRMSSIAEFEDLNFALSTFLLDRARTVPDVGSNRSDGQSSFDNKWLSDNRLCDLPDPSISRILRIVYDAANASPWPHVASNSPLRIISMWAIISRQGMLGRPHNHKGMVSGAYYVDAGQSEDSTDGAFVVYSAGGDISRIVRPQSGMLLMWPSAMVHGVQRYDSHRPRIVISFNLTA